MPLKTGIPVLQGGEDVKRRRSSGIASRQRDRIEADLRAHYAGKMAATGPDA